MSNQKSNWRIVGQVATGFSDSFTVKVQPITWEGFLDRMVEEKHLGPISLNLPNDPDPNLQGYQVVFISEHGYESEMFISPDWTDDDDTTRIEQLTTRYTPEQCQMAEIDAEQEAMLRTRAGGQENPGIKLLEEYNIRVSNILDGDPWANISQRVMEGEFRKLRITVTLETARQATNRHQEAVTNRTHGTQLLLRRQHEDPEYAIEEYWALIEDDSGPRLLGMIDNSRFMGITGMDVIGEIITPGQIVMNVCQHAESLPYMDEPARPEPAGRGETEETRETEETYTWRRKKNRLSAIVQGHTIRVKAATSGEFQEAIKRITGPKVVPVTTRVRQQDAQPPGNGSPESTQDQHARVHLHRHPQRHHHHTILHALTPRDRTRNRDHRILPGGHGAPGVHPAAPERAGKHAGAARIAERWLRPCHPAFEYRRQNPQPPDSAMHQKRT